MKNVGKDRIYWNSRDHEDPIWYEARQNQEWLLYLQLRDNSRREVDYLKELIDSIFSEAPKIFENYSSSSKFGNLRQLDKESIHRYLIYLFKAMEDQIKFQTRCGYDQTRIKAIREQGQYALSILPKTQGRDILFDEVLSSIMLFWATTESAEEAKSCLEALLNDQYRVFRSDIADLIRKCDHYATPERMQEAIRIVATLMKKQKDYDSRVEKGDAQGVEFYQILEKLTVGLVKKLASQKIELWLSCVEAMQLTEQPINADATANESV